MILEVNGDLLNSQCNVLVNTVNCHGVMGKGIALQFKRRYPTMYKKYAHDCGDKLYSPGDVHGYFEGNKIILNIATKDHWRGKSDYEWISRAIIKVKTFLDDSGHSIAIPALGCANGGLDWNVVRAMIYNELSGMDNVIELYPPA